MNLRNHLQILRDAHALIMEHCVYDSIEIDGVLVEGGDIGRDLDRACWDVEQEIAKERA